MDMLRSLIIIGIICSFLYNPSTFSQDSNSLRKPLVSYNAIYTLKDDLLSDTDSTSTATGQFRESYDRSTCKTVEQAIFEINVAHRDSSSYRAIVDATTSENAEGTILEYRKSMALNDDIETLNGLGYKHSERDNRLLKALPGEKHPIDNDVIFSPSFTDIVIRQARAGTKIFSSKIYNGGSEPTTVVTIIGNALANKSDHPQLQKQEFLNLIRWPIKLTYFSSDEDGEPYLTYSTELFENGLTGEYVRTSMLGLNLIGELKYLDIFPASPCAHSTQR